MTAQRGTHHHHHVTLRPFAIFLDVPLLPLFGSWPLRDFASWLGTLRVSGLSFFRLALLPFFLVDSGLPSGEFIFAFFPKYVSPFFL